MPLLQRHKSQLAADELTTVKKNLHSQGVEVDQEFVSTLRFELYYSFIVSCKFSLYSCEVSNCIDLPMNICIHLISLPQSDISLYCKIKEEALFVLIVLLNFSHFLNIKISQYVV